MKLSVSTNPSKEEVLLGYIHELNELNVDMIHCDTMDGEFVSNTCLSLDLVKTIKDHTTIMLDCHFMGYPDMDILQTYLKNGANILSLHIETVPLHDWKNYYKIVKKEHRLMGIVINPDTDVDALDLYLDYVDLILVMSVVPGKSGQTFMEGAYDRIKVIKGKIKDKKILLEVDGGITLDIAQKLKKLGVDIVVMGNSFYHADNKKELLKSIQNLS